MKTGELIGVSISDKRGTGKRNIGEGYLKEGYGLEGDAHAGTERQVGILLWEYAEELSKKQGFEVEPGDFAENLTVKGLVGEEFKLGTLLQVGESVLEVTQIGKVLTKDHTFNFHGFVLLADNGLFCKVVKGGKVKVGDKAKVISDKEF
ncbi:MAG TPA: MOSC domain-containing protein [Thermoanaerobacterales bacterium]|nr:MOSC domain-containing protein [Thermoanaerobacterales bacterium]